MKKSVFIWSFIVCVAVFMVFTAVLQRRNTRSNPVPSSHDTVLAAFQNLDVAANDCRLEAAGRWKDGELSYLERQTFLEQAALRLGISEGYILEVSETDGRESAGLTMNGKNADTSMAVISVKETQENYVLIRIRFPELTDSVFFYRDELNTLLEHYGIQGSVLMDVAGHVDGNLSQAEREELTNRFFSGLNAAVIEQSDSGELYTVYGYSQKIPEYLSVGGQPVNLNIAITYNELQDQTDVYVGMPFLKRDY